MKTLAALTIVTLTAGCLETSPSNSTAASGKVPTPLIIVGAAAPGARAATDLQADGLSVQTSFNGRAAGLAAFCSGKAHALALTPGKDLTTAERDHCRATKEGWGWSALTTQKGVGLYVRHEFAQDLLDQATTAL